MVQNKPNLRFLDVSVKGRVHSSRNQLYVKLGAAARTGTIYCPCMRCNILDRPRMQKLQIQSRRKKRKRATKPDAVQGRLVKYYMKSYVC